MHMNSSSKSAREKNRTLGRSPSCDRHRSQSRSSGHTRDRSRSHSILEEYIHCKRRDAGEHETISYTGRDIADYNIDEEKRVKYDWNHGRGSGGLEVDDPSEHSTSHSSIYMGKEDTHYHRESGDRKRSKGRDVDRDFRREKERERSRNREIDKVSGRGKERERSHERDRREVEKERGRRWEVDGYSRREKDRDRSWDTVVERGRRRERERVSRDRTRGGERDRDQESELDDKKWDRDRIKEGERRDCRNRHKYGHTYNDKNKDLVHKDGHDSQDKYRQSRRSRHEETDHYQDRRRTSGPQNSLERGEDKIGR